MIQYMSDKIVIIMAGGLGKRMYSDLPKVLHKIANQPMLVHIVRQAMQICPKKIFIVVGKYRAIIEETLSNYISLELEKVQFIDQPEALGTGHAILCCRNELLSEKNTKILILSGDTPLIQSSTIQEIITDLHAAKIVTTVMDNPYGYGRIVEVNGLFERICEEKDCSNEEKLIQKVNCGIYAFDAELLCKYLPLIRNDNAQQEYYLTDIIELIQRGENIQIDLYTIPKERQMEIMGVNTREQLVELEEIMKPFCFEKDCDFSERWV